jgi:hypothetical protein
MSCIVWRAIFGTTLIFHFFVGLGVVFMFSAGASLSITSKNETGYSPEEVKYGLEAGDTKILVEQAQDVPNSGSCTFRLEQEGAYRIYASLTIDGKRVYAKGNSYNLHDGGSYRLTLQKVVSGQPGAGVSLVNKSEFGTIKRR